MTKFYIFVHKKTIMKELFFSVVACLLLISCSDEKKDVDKNAVQQTKGEKYQMDVFQINENDFNVICLNRFTGSVFVRNNNGIWYNAQDQKDLKKYDSPVYSMKIIKGTEKMFQIVLLNSKNGNVYVRSYASTWYDASGIRALEN